MTFNIDRMRESKRAHRERLASNPIAEKLRMLDSLREREIPLRGNASRRRAGKVRENAPPYRAKE